jgi:hypothetical protein
MEDPDIDTITSQESDGAPGNVDCDGIIVASPTADQLGNIKADTRLIVRGGRFTDCRGRSIKARMESNIIDGVMFVRQGLKSIDYGCEVDFQYGSGSFIHCKAQYADLPGTPFGAHFAVVTGTCRGLAAQEGHLVIDDIEVVNNLPAASGAMPFFLSPASTEEGGLGPGIWQSINLSKITFLGAGKLNNLVYGNLSRVKTLRVAEVYPLSLTDAMIHGSVSGSEACTVEVSGNYNAGASKPLVNVTSGYLPKIQAHSNVGFNFIGQPVIETVTLADGASHIFTKRGYGTVGCIYRINSNYDRTANGIFAHDGTALDMTGGASTSIAYGNTSNPDLVGKLNVWRDANGCINIKNLLGSERIIWLATDG